MIEKTSYFITLSKEKRIDYIKNVIKNKRPHKKIELFRIIHEELIEEQSRNSVAFQDQDIEESFINSLIIYQKT